MPMTNSEPNAPATPFWRFSLHFYRQPGVAEACIALQDGSGVDVNLLLFVMWLAVAGQHLSHEDVQKLEDTVRGWRNLTIVPIRDVRRELKGQATLVEAGKQEAFRNRIKAVELEAERLQQEALYEAAHRSPPGTPSTPSEAVRANLAAYARVLGESFPKLAIDALIVAFDGIDHGAFQPARSDRRK
jgi:uncharacterized protein (TIGR02444 family)